MGPARRYRILSVLGQGGFGTVYRARLLGESGFSKPVALKVLNPELAAANGLARRLRDEARVLGLVQHRAIVKVDALVQLGGRWTVVMEYVEGRDLKTILERGPVPLGPALEIAAEVAGALHAAWTATGTDDAPLNLLHRDIKPANICVTALGEVKVLDFGIARANFGDREAHTQSQAYGTPDYMAPERFLFENGPEADIYALGATLYEMVLGAQLGRASPREQTHDELLEGRLGLLREALGDGHEDVVALLADLLAWAPERRPVARETERRLARLRHAKEGPLLRDWAETALPDLVAAQEARVDGSTGTMLVEGEGPRELPPSAENAWGSDPATQASATYALPAPRSAPTLAVEVEPTPTIAARPAARWPLVATLALLALVTAAAVWLGARPLFEPQAAAPLQPAAAPVAPTAPSPAPAPETTPPVNQEIKSSSNPIAAPVESTSDAASQDRAPESAAPPRVSRAPEAPARAPVEAQPTSSSGRWEGSLNGRPMDLVLSGGASVSGQVIVSFGANSVSSKVRGTYTAGTRTLTLEDVEQTDDAGTYTATLSEDGSRMTGSFHARSGGTVVAWTASRSGR